MADEIDLKAIWQSSKKSTANPKLEGLNLLHKGKRSSLEWIRIILTIEFWISIVLAPVMVIYMKSSEVYSNWMIVFYLIVTVVYLFYYQFLIRKIKGFTYDGNVLESLKRIYGYLRFYLLHYKVVVWLSLLVGFLASLFAEPNQEVKENMSDPKFLAVFIGVSVVLLCLAGAIFHLLLYLIYGRKVKRIKTTINSLSTEKKV